MLQKHKATITTDSSGNATVYVGSNIRGAIHAILYEPGTLESANLTITGETTGVPILTKAGAGTSDVWFYPRALANQNTDGAAGTSPDVPIQVVEERIKVVVASGGDTLAGSITVWVDE